VDIYENYLRERNASYFSIEATAGKNRHKSQELYSQFSGYERIAVLVLQALHSEEPLAIPLTVRNGGALKDLDANDAVELPCLVSSKGVQVLEVGKAPEGVRALLQQVKEYERLTVRALLENSLETGVAALAKNPLVAKADVARKILMEYKSAFGTQMELQQA
jgi:6-phospho-beta-glucosidase